MSTGIYEKRFSIAYQLVAVSSQWKGKASRSEKMVQKNSCPTVPEVLAHRVGAAGRLGAQSIYSIAPKAHIRWSERMCLSPMCTRHTVL